MSKDIDRIAKDIEELKLEIKSINDKIDIILEIMNNLSIMVSEEDEDIEDYDDYDTEHSWLPEEEDEWNSHQDES